MSESAHQEKHFQNYIISQLVEQGWKLGETKHYDSERALYPEDLVTWIKDSNQKEKWEKLERLNEKKPSKYSWIALLKRSKNMARFRCYARVSQ